MSAKSILVIEDDECSRKLVRDVLGFHGYAVREAADGETGLQLANEALPDLVLLDIQLPGIGGREVLQALRRLKDGAALPVVAVTASVVTPAHQAAAFEGFTAVASKPLEMSAFLTQIGLLLGD